MYALNQFSLSFKANTGKDNCGVDTLFPTSTVTLLNDAFLLFCLNLKPQICTYCSSPFLSPSPSHCSLSAKPRVTKYRDIRDSLA